MTFQDGFRLRSLTFTLAVQILQVVTQLVPQPQFSRNCTEDIILDHQKRNGHTYCSHACAQNSNDTVTGTCDDNGMCICKQSCTNEEVMISTPAAFINSSICPAPMRDPTDPDPNALPSCRATCAAFCVGGRSEICGDTTPLGTEHNIFAKICTCVCPPTRCQQETTTVEQNLTSTEMDISTTQPTTPANSTVTTTPTPPILDQLILFVLNCLIKNGTNPNLWGY